ncbi:MAG: lipopolysaccharide biosynthesis protein, partial [Erysipelotrichaceae bacterium]
VPMTIDYVDVETYGVWLTLSSVVAWMSFFDIGLNNGLKNRFAEAKACGDINLAQRYVSTTYAMLCLIFIPLFILFTLANRFVNWAKVFNINGIAEDELAFVMLIIVGYFCIKFIISTINVILTADQKPAAATLRVLMENIASLLVILVLKETTDGSLENLCLAICITPLIVVSLFSIQLYRGKYANIKPKISKIDFKLLPNIFSLGLKFFVIQIAGLIQFQTSNFIIMREWGGVDVTNYNIAYKYFTVLSMVMTIMITPIWSAATDAYAKKDYTWITNVVNKYIKLFICFSVIGLGMLIISPYVYDLWLGKGVVNIPFNLSFWCYIYVVVMMFGGIYVSILNGIGTLKIQFYSSLISPILFIAICYIMINYFNAGVSSILIASVFANFNGYILAPLQFRNIFTKNRQGIWTK